MRQHGFIESPAGDSIKFKTYFEQSMMLTVQYMKVTKPVEGKGNI